MTPLGSVRLLLIDGNNLLHRTTGGVDAGGIRLLLAKLSSAVPASVETIVMLDGHPASGTDRRQRVRRGLEIHHAGSRSADDALLELVRDATPADRAVITIVSDDRALTEKARFLGARTQRLDWLTGLLEGPSAPSPGIGRRGIRPPPQIGAEQEREPWRPGRGATRKKGNPRREGR